MGSVVQIVAAAAAFSLAGVFFWAAVAKLRSRSETTSEFANLGLLGGATLSWLVPVLELACVVGLVWYPGWGGVAAFAMLAGFTAVLGSALYSTRATDNDLRCACFGVGSNQPISSRLIWRNVGLLMVAALATAFDGSISSVL